MKLFLVLLLSVSLLSGCSMFGRTTPIEVTAVAGTRLPLLIQEPEPLQLRAPRWIVVTPENVDAVWTQLEAQNADLVLFALTDNGYEQLSLTFAEIRNRIQLQREINLLYRNYYEGE